MSELALYDIAGTPGVAADVSHINSKAAVKGYAGVQAQGPRVVLRGGHAWLLLENWWVPTSTARRQSRAMRVRGVLVVPGLMQACCWKFVGAQGSPTGRGAGRRWLLPALLALALRFNLGEKANLCFFCPGEDQLGEALKGADVVIIPAGVPRKPGMTRDDLFKVGWSQLASLLGLSGFG